MTTRSRFEEGPVAPRAFAALSSNAVMVVGFGAREGGLAIVFFSRRPDASLVSDPARAGEVDGIALGPSGDLAPVPEVGVGTGEEGKRGSPDPGSDEDGGVDTKGIPAETVKKEKEKSANYLPKKKGWQSRLPGRGAEICRYFSNLAPS